MLWRKRWINAFNGCFCGNDVKFPASVIPIAVGAAMSHKMKKDIVVVFFGDAAVEEGVFHESANFASLHDLPILFVCENNRYSCFTEINKRQPSEDLIRLANVMK